MSRDSWGKDTNFTRKGIMVRCVREDESTTVNVLHYLNNGNCIISFGNPYKQRIPIMLILKALLDTTDKDIYMRVMNGMQSKFFHERLEFQLADFKEKFRDLTNQESCLRFLGETFSRTEEGVERSQEELVLAGKDMLDRWLLIHLDTPRDKFNFIVLMIQKLFMYANNEIKDDDQDSIANQEVLTGPQVYIQILRNGIEKVMDMRMKDWKTLDFIKNISMNGFIQDSLRRIL
jgi:DNA-directed RNA polymerase I subunit RPA2